MMKERKPILIANWKMNLDYKGELKLWDELDEVVTDEVASRVDTVICPSFLTLGVLAGRESGKFVMGAQNVYSEERGSFTGEISARGLKGVAEYVLVGHSERRKYLAETDEQVLKKMVLVLAEKMVPVVLVGESLITRKKGNTKGFLERQLDKIFTSASRSSTSPSGPVIFTSPSERSDRSFSPTISKPSL